MIINSIKLLIALFGVVITFASCEYPKMADAAYPEQIIYMPAAKQGFFVINSVSKAIGSVPTPGQPYKYVVDSASRKFIVPLGVFRGGVNSDGGFKVDIAVNTDTITKLITAGSLAGTDILPTGKYSIASSVVVLSGEEFTPFDLNVDLDFLRNNPNKKFALGVAISSTQRKSNPALSTTIVVIDTKMMIPIANFTAKPDATNPKKIIFTNTSLNALSYSWNFGDGSSASTDMAPTYTFAAAGTYTVMLTAIGITGDMDKSTKTAVIKIP